MIRIFNICIVLVYLVGCADIPYEEYNDEMDSFKRSDEIGKADGYQKNKLTHSEGVRSAAEPWWSNSVDFPYDSSHLADWVEYQWRNQLNIRVDSSPYVSPEIKRQGATLHNWPEGNGYTVTDFHGVELRLNEADPKRNAQALLRMIRDNPSNLGGGPGTTDFSDELGWPSVQPNEERTPGEVIFLDLYGPDNAGIAFIDTDISDQQFCVITVTHPQTGWHPVNGIRCWGYIEWPRGGQYTHLFYTTGVDSTTVSGAGWLGSHLQFETWNSQMVAIARQVECIWYSDAGYIWEDDEVQEWLNKTPGSLTLSDVDHPGDWDSIKDASPQYEYACP